MHEENKQIQNAQAQAEMLPYLCLDEVNAEITEDLECIKFYLTFSNRGNGSAFDISVGPVKKKKIGNQTIHYLYQDRYEKNGLYSFNNYISVPRPQPLQVGNEMNIDLRYSKYGDDGFACASMCSGLAGNVELELYFSDSGNAQYKQSFAFQYRVVTGSGSTNDKLRCEIGKKTGDRPILR